MKLVFPAFVGILFLLYLAGSKGRKLQVFPQSSNESLLHSEPNSVTSNSGLFVSLEQNFSIATQTKLLPEISTIQLDVLSKRSLVSPIDWNNLPEGFHIRIDAVFDKAEPVAAMEEKITANLVEIVEELLPNFLRFKNAKDNSTFISTFSYASISCSFSQILHGRAINNGQEHSCYLYSMPIVHLDKGIDRLPSFFFPSRTQGKSLLFKSLQSTISIAESINLFPNDHAVGIDWHPFYLSFKLQKSRKDSSYLNVDMSEVISSKLVVDAIEDAGKKAQRIDINNWDKIELRELSGRHNAIGKLISHSIVGDGFHQEVLIEMKVKKARISSCSSNWIALIQHIPRHLYLDIDELKQLERVGKFKVVSFEKHIDVEKPASISRQHSVMLLFNATPQSESPSPKELLFKMLFPIHFRYQAPSFNLTYGDVPIPAPSVFTVCPNLSEDMNENGDMSLQNEIHKSAFSRITVFPSLKQINGQVPVGQMKHGEFVSGVTVLFTFIGAFALLVCLTKISKT